MRLSYYNEWKIFQNAMRCKSKGEIAMTAAAYVAKRFMLSGKHNYAAFYYEIKTRSQAPNVFTSARFSHLEVVVLIEIVKIATILKRNHSRVQNTDEM